MWGILTQEVMKRKTRREVNLQTGEEMQILAEKTPKLRVGKDPKEKVG